MSSAQLYWGRMAALLLRLLYHLFPAVDWGFVYVDDFAWLIRASFVHPLSTAVLVFLLAMGVPLSWGKTCLALANVWLGFQLDTRTGVLLMARDKHVVVDLSLQRLEAGDPFTLDEISSLLGRIQWATAICPTMKAFLQPFWAWKTAVKSAGRPSKLLRCLASCLRIMISMRSVRPSPFNGMCHWHGASDAGASEDSVYVAGWFSNRPNPDRKDCFWFWWPVEQRSHGWAFDKGDPQKRIHALEMFGTLLLVYYMTQKAPSNIDVPMFLPFCTDNEGCAYNILNDKTRQWPSSAILMELLLQAQAAGVQLAPAHVKREFNTWADGIGKGDHVLFDPEKRVHPEMQPPGWLVLDSLLALSKA